MTSAPAGPIPRGTAALADLLGVDLDDDVLSGRRPIVVPEVAVVGYGAETWRAFVDLLMDRVAELEKENEQLRAGAMHPTARELLDLFEARLDAALGAVVADGSRERAVLAQPLTIEPSPEAATTGDIGDLGDLSEQHDLGDLDDLADVGAADEAAVAAVAAAPEGVEFWDEAETHGLIGRGRRLLRRRRRTAPPQTVTPPRSELGDEVATTGDVGDHEVDRAEAA